MSRHKPALATYAAMPRRLLVCIAALAAVAGACSDGDGNKVDATSKRTTTSVRDHSTTSLAGGTTTIPGSATTVKGATATTTHGRGGSAPVTSGGSSPTADPNAAPGPATQGTYNYSQSGQVGGEPVPPNGTLVVSGGGPSQVFHRYFDTGQQPSDIYYTFRDDGPFITKIVVRQQGAAITCTFGSPVPAPPWPPTAGRTFSGHATCDGGFAADFNGSVGGHVSDSVAGKSVDSITIDSTLHVTGQIFGQAIDITVKDTQHWAPSLRVPTYSHETISGTAGAQPITGDVTSTLTSTP
jgi:hypothetical protein